MNKLLVYPATVAAVVLAVAGGSLVTDLLPDHHTPAGDQPTPAAGQALVVEANLQDAVRPADAADLTDIDNFARRLLASTPHAPDALLLTEVLGPGADHLADQLSARTHQHYRVVAAGARSPWLPDGTVRENAIIIDGDTLATTDTSGFRTVEDEDQPYARVTQRRTGAALTLLAAHPAGDTAPAATAFEQVVDDTAGNGDIRVIGGDFRDARCAVPSNDQAIGCDAQAYWNDLTQAHAYEDATYDATDAQRRGDSNFLFVKGTVDRAYVDTGYQDTIADPAACKAAFDGGRSAAAGPACRSAYYADTPFRWALVGPSAPTQHTVIPGTATMDHCQLDSRTATIVARIVNNTDAATTTPVSAEATAPIQVAGGQSVTVPAGEARDVPIALTASRSDTPVGTYHVTVHVGEDTTSVGVEVPTQCTEPKAIATSFHAGYPPENAVDGDVNTFWHSEYQPTTPLPQSITVNLGQTETIGELDYQPRVDGNLNGAILAYNVYTSTDGKTFTQVATGTWAADARLKTATFPATDARYIRLEGTKGNGGSYVSAAEITVK